jgi:hypothetical protein
MGRDGREMEGMGRNGKEWEGMGRNGNEWERMRRNGKEWKGMGKNVGKTISLKFRSRSLNGYIEDMKERGQSEERIEEVTGILVNALLTNWDPEDDDDL